MEQHIDLEAVLEEFRDHWTGVAGDKGSKLTWDGTFRNRVRDLVKWGRAPALNRDDELPILRLANRDDFIPKPDDPVDELTAGVGAAMGLVAK